MDRRLVEGLAFESILSAGIEEGSAKMARGEEAVGEVDMLALVGSFRNRQVCVQKDPPTQEGDCCICQTCSTRVTASLYAAPPPCFLKDTFSTPTFSTPFASVFNWYTYSTSTSPCT